MRRPAQISRFSLTVKPSMFISVRHTCHRALQPQMLDRLCHLSAKLSASHRRAYAWKPTLEDLDAVLAQIERMHALRVA